MIRFIRNIALFLLPVLASIPLLRVENGFAWRFVKGDCYAHGAWLLNRLNTCPEPADVVFAGSSRTIHAVWERSVEDSLSINYDKKLRLLNLGYCRFGNNLPYAIIKEALKTKRPGTIVWEVRETEDCCSHPLFGYVADGEDVWLPAVFPHKRILADWWHAATIRVEYGQYVLFGDKNAEMEVDTSLYGYGSEPGVADKAALERIGAKKRRHPESDVDKGPPPEFPRTYIEKAADMARSAGARFVFLYVPEYGSVRAYPRYLSYYQTLGPVWLPPPEVLDEPANWMDASHLNDRGAAALSGWLAGCIAELK